MPFTSLPSLISLTPLTYVTSIRGPSHLNRLPDFSYLTQSTHLSQPTQFTQPTHLTQPTHHTISHSYKLKKGRGLVWSRQAKKRRKMRRSLLTDIETHIIRSQTVIRKTKQMRQMALTIPFKYEEQTPETFPPILRHHLPQSAPEDLLERLELEAEQLLDKEVLVKVMEEAEAKEGGQFSDHTNISPEAFSSPEWMGDRAVRSMEDVWGGRGEHVERDMGDEEYQSKRIERSNAKADTHEERIDVPRDLPTIGLKDDMDEGYDENLPVALARGLKKRKIRKKFIQTTFKNRPSEKFTWWDILPTVEHLRLEEKLQAKRNSANDSVFNRRFSILSEPIA
eukprot:GHVN01045384.1.p1 GENE.GHVN01045384.1~~GHVN01045384.1.p1  ORF type:complete len:388 (+),score=118.05 GHVN01045384.1:153-1166(+)